MDALIPYIPALSAAIGAAVAVVVVNRIHLPKRPPPSLDGHLHTFDTMLGDGKGWRCGTCHQLKGR